MSLTFVALMLVQEPTGSPSTVSSTDALAYLDGVWTGPAWVTAPDGQRYEMTQTEIICPAVGGQVRLMEGLSEAGGRRLHHAVTIFEGRPDGAITMRAYTPGRVGQYPFQTTANGFEWLIDAGPQEYRYRSVVAGNTWREVGEVRTKSGGQWTQMFEMTLERQPNDHASSGTGCL